MDQRRGGYVGQGLCLVGFRAGGALK